MRRVPRSQQTPLPLRVLFFWTVCRSASPRVNGSFAPPSTHSRWDFSVLCISFFGFAFPGEPPTGTSSRSKCHSHVVNLASILPTRGHRWWPRGCVLLTSRFSFYIFSSDTTPRAPALAQRTRGHRQDLASGLSGGLGTEKETLFELADHPPHLLTCHITAIAASHLLSESHTAPSSAHDSMVFFFVRPKKKRHNGLSPLPRIPLQTSTYHRTPTDERVLQWRLVSWCLLSPTGECADAE